MLARRVTVKSRQGVGRRDMVVVRDIRPTDAQHVKAMMTRLAEQRKDSNHRLVLGDRYARFFPAYLESFVSDPDSVMKIAEDGGTVVGYAVATRAHQQPYYKYSKVARVSDVFVEKSHRRKGVAQALLRDVAAWAKESNLDALEVDAFPDHEEEVQALQSLGFEPFRLKLVRPLTS